MRMKLTEMKRIAEKRTKGEWFEKLAPDIRSVNSIYSYGDDPEERFDLLEIASEDDVLFIVQAANTYDQLLKVAECAKDLLESAMIHRDDRHYEVALKEALEELEK